MKELGGTPAFSFACFAPLGRQEGEGIDTQIYSIHLLFLYIYIMILYSF